MKRPKIKEWGDKPLPPPGKVRKVLNQDRMDLEYLYKFGPHVPDIVKAHRVELNIHTKWLAAVLREAERREKEKIMPFGRYAADNEFPLHLIFYSGD